MDLDGFWQLIERSRDADAQAVVLRALSLELPHDDIRAFSGIFDAQDTRATRYDIWGAGHVLDRGMGDDSFNDFRCWLISRGRDAFEAVLAHPDSLAGVPDLLRSRA